MARRGARPRRNCALLRLLAFAQRSDAARAYCCASRPVARGARLAGKPRITLDEFFNAVEFSKVAISPDGHMVAIATERADWDAERFRQDLWLWRDSDSVLIPLTQSGHDSDPKWSPDGRWIAFLSDRDADSDKSDKTDDDKKGVTHLYLIPVGGGEAFPVTRGAEDVHSFDWSPDSKTLYFATRIPWTQKQKDEYKEQWKDVIRYREQERGDVISRIGVADALARQMATGTQEPKKSKKDKKKDEDEETGETPGAQAVVTSPYRVKSMAISPDGNQIAYLTDSVSQRFEGLKEIEIYVADTSKAGPQNTARQLTKNEALEDELQWSRDGKDLFFEVVQGSVEGTYADLAAARVLGQRRHRTAHALGRELRRCGDALRPGRQWNAAGSRDAGHGDRALSAGIAAGIFPQAGGLARHLRTRGYGDKLSPHRIHLLGGGQAHRGLHRRQR